MVSSNIYGTLTAPQRIRRSMPGGLCHILYVPIDWVQYLPDINPLYNTITEPVRLLDGKGWMRLPVPDRDRALSEQPRNNDAGAYVDSTITAYLPYDSATNAVVLNAMRYYRYLVIIALPGGLRKIAGALQNPVRFEKQYNSGSNADADGGTTLSFTWTSESGAAVYRAIPNDDELAPLPPLHLIGDGSGTPLSDGEGTPLTA